MDMRRGHRRRSNARLQKDQYIELNRSIALFLIISKFLSFLCIIMLLVASDEYLHEILMVKQDGMEKLHHIPRTLRTSVVILGVQMCLSSIGGLYGYASLHNYMLFFYATSLVIIIAMVIAIAFGNQHFVSTSRERIFRNYKHHRTNERALNMLQNHLKCCGSNYYKFEDMAFLPTSCCPNITTGEKCVPSKAYRNLCEDITVRIRRRVLESDFTDIVMIILPSIAGFLFVEACLVFHLLYYLHVQKTKMILSSRKSSVWN